MSRLGFSTIMLCLLTTSQTVRGVEPKGRMSYREVKREEKEDDDDYDVDGDDDGVGRGEEEGVNKDLDWNSE